MSEAVGPHDTESDTGPQSSRVTFENHFGLREPQEPHVLNADWHSPPTVATEIA